MIDVCFAGTICRDKARNRLLTRQQPSPQLEGSPRLGAGLRHASS